MVATKKTDGDVIPFKNALPKEDCEKIVREIEVVDPAAASALLRKLDDYQLISDIATLIRERTGIEAKPALAKDEFRVLVRYEPIPSIKVLKTRFRHVNNYLSFDPIEACRNVLREPQELIMTYFKGSIVSDPLGTIDRAGFRPILYEELLALAGTTHGSAGPIAALGSVALVNGRRFVPTIESSSDGRTMDVRQLDEDPARDCRYFRIPVVRK